MTPPEALRTHRRRPAWWLLAGVVAAITFLALDVRRVRRDDAWREQVVEIEGVVAQDYDGSRTVPLVYRNAVTAQIVEAEAELWDDDLRPSAGDQVAMRFDFDDPLRVEIVGDRFPVTGNLPWYVAFVAIPLVWWAVRWRSVARLMRLVDDDAVSFALIGAIEPGRSWRRRAVLDLYPLDARPGDAPVCSVRLLTTGGCPVGGPAFPVEVKGVPRPASRLVARAGEAVLWPAGRALVRSGGVRPDTTASRRAPVPVPAAEVPAGAHRPVGRWWARDLRILALLLAAGVAITSTVVTLANAARERDDDRDRVDVVAEVVDVDLDDDAVPVLFLVPGEREPRRAAVGVDAAAGYPAGVRFPLRIDLDDPSNARFRRDPYDAVEPIVWAWLPVVVLVPVVVAARRRWVRSIAVARRGPWYQVEAWRSGDGLVRLGTAEDGYVRCAVDDRKAAPFVHHRPETLIVAGAPEPGRTVALVGRLGSTPVARRAVVPPGWASESVDTAPFAPSDPLAARGRPAVWPGGDPRARLDPPARSARTVRSLLGFLEGRPPVAVLVVGVAVLVGGPLGAAAALATAALVGVPAVLLVGGRLRVDRDGMELRNAWRTRRVSWSAVRSLEPSRTGTAGPSEHASRFAGTGLGWSLVVRLDGEAPVVLRASWRVSRRSFARVLNRVMPYVPPSVEWRSGGQPVPDDR